MTVSHDGRLRITYDLTCGEGEDPQLKAEDVALEQTVELPAAALATGDELSMVGAVESVEPGERGVWRAVISYAQEVVAGDVLQLMNVLFGNISLKDGILVRDVAWPVSLLDALAGPRFGIEGLRRLCGAGSTRPLSCVALKPVGLSVAQLADRSYEFAAAGVDIVKDDHGLAGQPSAPFEQRVLSCLDAVRRANAATGGRSVYFPNLTGPMATLEERLRLLDAHDCDGVLLSPLLVGLDTTQWIVRHSTVAVLSHPALAGAFFGERHGIAPDLLLGTLFRAIGSDGVIYPNVGGRFRLSQATCAAINAGLRRALGPLKPAFPVPGGGIDVARIHEWVQRYGADTIFLIGASIYGEPDRKRATERFVDAVRTRTAE